MTFARSDDSDDSDTTGRPKHSGMTCKRHKSRRVVVDIVVQGKRGVTRGKGGGGWQEKKYNR